MVEHVADLRETMAGLAGLLRPGGWFFSTLPNIDSLPARLSGERWNCILLEHLWYFSPATYRRFLGDLELDIRRVEGFNYPVDVATLLRRIEQTYGLRLPFAGSGRMIVRLPIGLMFVAGRKRG